jgi:sugar phosphate isomerase/epimerase
MSSHTPIVALQLFSIRNLGSLEDQLSAVSSAGFQAVEPLEEHLAQPVQLRRTLDTYGLIAPSAHVNLQTLKRDRSRIVDACKSSRIHQLFVPTVNDDVQTNSTDGWQRLGEEMGDLADTYKRDGITLGYHNKSVEFSLLRGGRYGFEVLFNAARGSALRWQADIAWLKRAGLDPIEWLQRYRRVLVSAHVKDQAPVGSNIDEDGWSDIGAGVLTWPSLWKAALDCGAESLVVEHDNPKEPFEFAKRSFAYVSRFNR